MVMKNRLRTLPTSGGLDLNSPTPLYRQLYELYRQAILSEQLRKDAQLPSTRELAYELGVSRNTVSNAFEQLLAEGYIRAEVGSGTFVAADFSNQPLHSPIPSGRKFRPQLELSSEAQRIARANYLHASLPAVPFRTGLPALDAFPLQTWAHVVARSAREARISDLNYSDPQGNLNLRTTIAQYLRQFRAVKCDPEQVFILSGSQQALHLVARMLVQAGDSVWMEEPGYPGARSAFSAVGAHVIPVQVDAEGLNVRHATRLRKRPKVIYVTPSHQFPLGVTMSLSRRVSLLNLAERANSWIVEDDYDTEFRHVGMPLSSLQGLNPNRVIYVGTFSKTMFPSLRLGYAILPEPLVRVFASSRRAADFCPPLHTQAAMNIFIVEGHFARHLRKMRRLYKERLSVMVNALSYEFGDLLRVSASHTGISLVAWLPEQIDDRHVTELASKSGILTIPLSSFYAGGKSKSGLFLGFGAITPNRIEEGTRKLGRVLKKLLIGS